MEKIMNKIGVIVVSFISLISAHSAFAGSFGQRWGANSTIYNLPLYFKDTIYENRKECDRKSAQQACSATIIVDNNEKKRQKTAAALQKMHAKQQKLAQKQAQLQSELASIDG